VQTKKVVVIGAGLGGLSAAIHARLKGHDVLVLEQNQIGGKAAKIQEKGYTLDPGPSIIILKEIYEQVFRDAGKDISHYLRFRRLDPITRVSFNNQIIDIPTDIKDAVDLISTFSQSDAKQFRDLYEKLKTVAPYIQRSVFSRPFDKPWQLLDPNLIRTALPFGLTKTYKALVDEMFESPLLRAFFYGFPSYGGQSYHSRGPGAFFIPFFMFDSGVWYPEGGVAAIPEAFHKLAVDLGVQFRQARIVGMGTHTKRVVSLQTEAKESISGFDYVISNRDRVTVQEWLGQKQPTTPSYSYFTIHFGVRKNLTEVKHHTLLVPDDFTAGFEALYEKRAFPERPIVYLNNTSETDSTVAPDGCTNLFAVITSPSDEPQVDWANRTNEYRERVISEISRHGIELGEVDFERIQSPIYFQQAHGNFKGSLYGADEQYRLFGLFPWNNQDDEFKNLLYAGGAVQPGAGLPMVTLSGKFAAGLIS
jgi:phytoene desaturase